jgi:NADH-quinone oxidoreductase subunit L
MTLPLILLAVASAIAGAIGIPELMGGHHWLAHQLMPIIGEAKEATLTHQTEWALMAASVSIAIIALLIALNKYKRQADDEPQTSLGKFLYHKWHIDELYDNIIVQPLNRFAGFLKNVVEKNVIDGAVNGTGRLVQYSARKLRLIQNGQVGYYILFIVLGIIVLFLCWFNDVAILRFLSFLTNKS